MIRPVIAVVGVLLAVVLLGAPAAHALPGPSAPGRPASATVTTAGPSGTSERLPGTTLEAEARDDGRTNAAAWIIGSGIAAAVAVGVGGLILKRRAE